MREDSAIKGRIIKGIGGFYYVDVAGAGIYECRARGIFRKDGKKPLVGDRVEIEILDESTKTGSVSDLLERDNSLIRPEAANIDQALVVFACAHPDPNLTLLDRFLITIASEDIPVILCFNKTDLVTKEETEYLTSIYRDAGVTLVAISAKEEKGFKKLSDLLCGKTTMLAGPSGVGKSTILNRFCPEAMADTGEISKKLGRGRHTTRHSELFKIEGMEEGSYLMDTPGFTALSLFDLDEMYVKAYYPEFFDYEGKCRFMECSHTHEPDCAVKAAVKKDASDKGISKVRYENYRLIYEEQKNRKRF